MVLVCGTAYNTFYSYSKIATPNHIQGTTMAFGDGSAESIGFREFVIPRYTSTDSCKNFLVTADVLHGTRY